MNMNDAKFNDILDGIERKLLKIEESSKLVEESRREVMQKIADNSNLIDKLKERTANGEDVSNERARIAENYSDLARDLTVLDEKNIELYKQRKEEERRRDNLRILNRRISEDKNELKNDPNDSLKKED